MFSVGLTGGIASGKTTISNLFVDLGVPIVDTDVISRELLQPGENAYNQVCTHFGRRIIGSNNEIDRAELRQIVFTDATEKSWLETMLHPLIFQRSHNAMLEHTRSDYVLVVVPLLFETNFQSLVDRILVVNCSAELQIERLVARDHIDEVLARNMMAQQLSNVERLSKAHDVIENRGNEKELAAQVDRLHQRYLKLSSNQDE